NQLPPKTLTPSNRGAIALTMARCIGKIAARGTSASPFTSNPVERVAGCFTARANHSPPDPALTPAHGRHGPLAQTDLDLDASRRDHDHPLAGPGDLRVEGAGMVFPL